MELYNENFSNVIAPPAVEININHNILYTEEFSYLTRDELEVLFLFASTEMYMEGITSFSFSGIKRQLGKHQQKITKAVNRLLSKNLLEKNGLSYSLSSKATEILFEIAKKQNAFNFHQPSEEFLQQRILFSSEVNLTELITIFIGKWFGSFRYISHIEGKNLVIRWQLVDSRIFATLQLYINKAILTIFPEKYPSKDYPYEQALDELSRYISEILTTKGLNTKIVHDGWQKGKMSEIDYQQKLFTWLNTSNNPLSEN